MKVLPRDFIETGEGLVFAVVDPVLENGKVLCFLRYVPDVLRTGRLRKLDTEAANDYLDLHHPAYRHHSARLDANLHAVPTRSIRHHHLPRQRLENLLRFGPTDALEGRLCRLVRLFTAGGIDPAELGVTGSLLIGAQTPESDIDLVAYDRRSFLSARDLIASALADGRFGELDDRAWRQAYRRRGCALGFDEFVWHERRKANKALFEGTKFDLTLVLAMPEQPAAMWRKRGNLTLRARVLDASAAFDTPALYRIDHPEIPEIVVFTHTYVGQAQAGEMIEAAGQVECDSRNRRRLVIGTSREAPGEYLRAWRSGADPGD